MYVCMYIIYYKPGWRVSLQRLFYVVVLLSSCFGVGWVEVLPALPVNRILLRAIC